MPFQQNCQSALSRHQHFSCWNSWASTNRLLFHSRLPQLLKEKSAGGRAKSLSEVKEHWRTILRMDHFEATPSQKANSSSSLPVVNSYWLSLITVFAFTHLGTEKFRDLSRDWINIVLFLPFFAFHWCLAICLYYDFTNIQIPFWLAFVTLAITAARCSYRALHIIHKRSGFSRSHDGIQGRTYECQNARQGSVFFSLFSEASFQDLFHFFNATASFFMLLLPSGYNGNTTVISPLQKATLFRKEHGKQALKGNTC